MKIQHGLLGLLFVLISSSAYAINMDVYEGREDEHKPMKLVVPYAFYNETTDAAAAVAVVASGYLQPQIQYVANVFYSTNSSRNFFLMAKDVQMPLFNRLFMDIMLVNGEWGLIESYRDGNPNFPDERAGSNDSHKNNFIESEGGDDYYRAFFRYLLPIGHGKGNPIHKFVLKPNGLLVPGHEAGGIEWNPFTSGRTTIDFELFTREQDIEDELDIDIQLKTTGFLLGLEYDNTDYYKNPSYGSRQRFAVSRDWGLHDEDGSEWTTIEFEYSKFFNLGQTEKALQRVLAFNAWFIDTPTWDDYSMRDGDRVYHRPPNFAGATLGGLFRQRAYPAARFNDRSAVNYALEYRYMPAWNPFPGIPLLNKLHIPWWHWVGFAEIGRVHDEWELDELHKDMKWSLGAGLRLLVYGVVARIDLATSDEQSEIQMFIGHSF